MKKIEAFIKPFRIDEVTAALNKIPNFPGMTVIQARGFGRQKGHTVIYRGDEKIVEFLQKIKIECFCPDDMADLIVQAITKGAKTGKIGDGKIFVSSVERALRIRTDEHGDSAI